MTMPFDRRRELPPLSPGYYWHWGPDYGAGEAPGIRIDRNPNTPDERFDDTYLIMARGLSSQFRSALAAQGGQGTTGYKIGPGTNAELLRAFGASEIDIARYHSPEYFERAQQPGVAREQAEKFEAERQLIAEEKASQPDLGQYANAPHKEPISPPSSDSFTQSSGFTREQLTAMGAVDLGNDQWVTKNRWDKLDPKYQSIGRQYGFDAMSSAIDAENRDAAKQQGEYDSAMKALEPYRVGKVPLGYAGPEPAENQYYIGKAIQDGVDRRALNIAFGKETVDQAEKALKELPKLPSSDLRSQFSKLTPEQQSRLPDVFGTAKVGPFTVSKEHEQEVRFGLGAIPGVNEAVFWNEMDNGQRATAIAIDIAVLAGPFLIAKALGALRGAQAARLAASLRNSDAGLDTLKSFDSSLVKPVQAVNAAKADYVASRMRVADLEKTLATTQSKAAPAHMVSEFQKGPIINELADVERSLEIARASAQDARATLAAKAQVVSTKLLDAKPFESFPSPQVRGQATKAIQNLPRSVVENTDSMIESTIKPKTARGIPEIQADLKQAQARLSAAAEKGYNTEPLRRDIMGLKGELLVQNVAEIQVLERAARNQTNLVYQLEKMKRPPGTFSAAEEPRLALSVEDQLKAVRTEQKAIGEQLNAAYKRMRKLEVEGEARGGGIATRTRIIPITERPTMLTTAEGKRIKIGIPTGKTIGGGVSSAKPKEVIASFITAKGQPIVITKPVTSVTPSEVPGIEPARRGKESTNPEEIPSIKPMSANQPRQASQTKTDTKTTQEIKTGEISKPGGGIESSGKPTPKVEPQPKAETRTPTKPKIPERIKTPDKPKEPIKFPKRKTLGEQQALIERAARDGAITWKQGALHEPQYKLWVYPYDKGDFTTVSSIPKGANLVSGIGSARKTAKVLRGKAPDTAKTADIGAFLATVTPVDREKRKISVTFRPDPANKIHIRTGQTLVEVHRRPIRVVPPTRRPPRLPRVDADLHSLRRGKIFYTPMRGGVALSRHSLGRRGRRK